MISLQWLEYHGLWLLMFNNNSGAAITQIYGGASVSGKIPSYTRDNLSTVTLNWTNVYDGYPGSIINGFFRLS